MLFNLKMFLPDFSIDKVENINLERLKDLGFDSIILDLDNTLVSWKTKAITEDVKNWIKKAQSLGFKLCIVSNCLLRGRVKFFSDLLNIPFVFRAIKPRKKAFVDALKILDTVPDKTVVIGDQVFTDVLGGNRMGFLTILVVPVDKREFYITILQRTMEKILLSGPRKKGLIPVFDEHSECSVEKRPKTNLTKDSTNEGKK